MPGTQRAHSPGPNSATVLSSLTHPIEIALTRTGPCTSACRRQPRTRWTTSAHGTNVVTEPARSLAASTPPAYSQPTLNAVTGAAAASGFLWAPVAWDSYLWSPCRYPLNMSLVPPIDSAEPYRAQMRHCSTRSKFFSLSSRSDPVPRGITAVFKLCCFACG